jgi:hypothetical protein
MKFVEMQDRAKEMLSAPGWFPGRHIEHSDYYRRLKNYGFSISDDCIKFIQEFGGLRIPFVNRIRVKDYISTDICSFATIDVEALGFDSEAIGIGLCPVAELSNQFDYLYIGSDGLFYYGVGTFLETVGNNAIEACTRIIFEESGIVVLGLTEVDETNTGV